MQPWPLEAIHAALMPTYPAGQPLNITWQVLMWDKGLYTGVTNTTTVTARLWPALNMASRDNPSACFTDVNFILANSFGYTIYCTGHSFEEGRLVLAGGEFFDANGIETVRGAIRSYYFNPVGPPFSPSNWVTQGNLGDPVCLPPPNQTICNDAGGRYYPTNVTVLHPDNPNRAHVLTVHGGDRRSTTCSVPCPPPNPAACSNRSVEKYDPVAPVANQWLGQSINIPIDPVTAQYPWLHVLPQSPTTDPQIFFSGSFEGCAGASTRYARKYNVNTRTWGQQLEPAQTLDRVHGTSVLLPFKDPAVSGADGGKILIVGGTGGNKDTAQYYCVSPVTDTISCPGLTEGWRDAQNMSTGRERHSAVILPDGNVLIVGGEGCVNCVCNPALYDAELYTPSTRTFSVIPADLVQRRPRGYHHTTLLLPDGAVFIAGGDTDKSCDCPGGGPSCPTAQIYYPGYFYRGTRPSITNITTRDVRYDNSFTVTINQPIGAGAKVVLIKATSMTHSFASDQRSIELDFTPQGNYTLTVRSPKNANVAAPGYYMLFVVKQTAAGQALPTEIGEFIHVGPVPPQ